MGKLRYGLCVGAAALAGAWSGFSHRPTLSAPAANPLPMFDSSPPWGGGSPYRGQYWVGAFDRAPFGALRPSDTIGVLGTLVDIATSPPGATRPRGGIGE